MKTFKFNLALIAFIYLLFTSCATDDNGIYFDNVAEVNVEYSEMELEILNLVNDHRIAKGLTSLEKMNVVSSVAESHTNYMAETGIVSHDHFTERHQKLVNKADAKIVGENVGFGFTTAKGVVDAWLRSDGHRGIIEKASYTHFGISTEQNVEGRNYFTQIFIAR
jgi:uncharacterized protein YkwD